MESAAKMQSQYNGSSSPAPKKKDHVRFEEPLPVLDNEETPLLAHEDLEPGRRRRRSARDYEEEKSSSPLSLRNLILRNLLLISLACVFVVGTAFVCVRDLVSQYKTKTMALCTSPSCVLAAAELIGDMSPNYAQINPCDDFHRYTCEGFDRLHTIRPDQTSSNTLSLMSETAQAILRQVLESPHFTISDDSAAEQENYQKLKNAYDTCMNETEIETRGNAPLLGLLSDLQEGSPANKTNSTLEGVDYLLSLGVDALISIGVGEDDKNPEQQIIMMSRPSLGLRAKQYYKDEQQLALYKETIGLVFEKLSKDHALDSNEYATLRENLAGASTPASVKSLVDFEAKIAEITPNPEDANDPTFYYNPMNYTEVEELLPQIPVSNLVKKRSPKYLPAGKLIVQSPAYMKGLSNMLKDTPEDTLDLYFRWKIIMGYYDSVISDATKPIRSFFNRLGGRSTDPERWRICVNHVDEGLSWILSYHYIKEAFSEDSKDFGDRVILDIKDSFIKKLHGSEWMSKEVQDVAVQKVQSIRQKVGYPTAHPNVKDPQDVQRFHSAINITNNDFFSNIRSIINYALAKEWSNAGKPTDKDDWKMTATTVNAYYNPPMGEIVFPAAIMQRPAFHNPTVPQYLSYGSFGSVAGHELSHAFDNTGRRYDVKGRLADWWDNETVAAFEAKAQCYVDQYSNFTVPDPSGGEAIHVNGKLTLGENIADAGGVSAAFQAWKRREAKKPGALLPGLLDFTKEQLFFISYANTWCGVVRPEEVRNRVLTDPHSPMKWRIQGTLQNSREFREAFNCPVKEPTCELW